MICSLAIISAEPQGNPNMNFFGFNRSSSLQTNTLQTIDAQTLKHWLDQQTVILLTSSTPNPLGMDADSGS